MKKIVSLIMILVVIAGLSGCGTKTAPSDKADSKETSVSDMKNKESDSASNESSESKDAAANESSESKDAAANESSESKDTATSESSENKDSATSESSDRNNKVSSASGYNIEYEVIGYKNQHEEDVNYYTESDYEYMWTRQMIITGIYGKKTLSINTPFLGNSFGEESYGTRPMDEPSGELQDWFQYNDMGEITDSGRSLYLYYDFDSPVLEDKEFGVKYYFKRTSDKWEW